MRKSAPKVLCDGCIHSGGRLEPKWDRYGLCKGEKKIIKVYFCNEYKEKPPVETDGISKKF